MNKRRCSGCREYFRPDQMLVSSGIQAFCSQPCIDAKRYRAPAQRGISRSLRKRVLKRDDYMCAYCRCGARVSGNPLHPHHVLYKSEGGKNLIENLITLCAKHHNMVHSSKRRWQPVLLAYVARIESGRNGGLALLEKTMNKELV